MLLLKGSECLFVLIEATELVADIVSGSGIVSIQLVCISVLFQMWYCNAN